MKKAIMVLLALMVMLVPCALADYHYTVFKRAPTGLVIRGTPLMYNVNAAVYQKTTVRTGNVYYNTQGEINGWTTNGWLSAQWDVKASDYKEILEDSATTVKIRTYITVNNQITSAVLTFDKVNKTVNVVSPLFNFAG